MTPAPRRAISSISVLVISFILCAFFTTRGSAEYTPSTSVKISHISACIAPASATAVASLPPRPSVATSPFSIRPWKPATMTILPSSSSLKTRSGFTSSMVALPYAPPAMIPACGPVSDTAGTPSFLKVIAIREMEICSPVASSISISRP